MIKRIYSIAKKSISILKDDGPARFAKRAVAYVYYRQFPDKKKKYYKDILFINGCELPHPERYRVGHQIEQLISQGLTADSVFYTNLSLEQLKYYRGFVFFRCPVTDTIREFIRRANFFNKTCFFDIDDLVIDERYTDTIKYVRDMSDDNKQIYNDGVNRMRETLELCDHVITTTDQLQVELQKYTKGEVLINRNTASDEMTRLSNLAIKSVKRDDGKIVIGYFSGSITHNEDFELVVPSLVKLFEKHQNLYLRVAGILDIPKGLEMYKDRLITTGFTSWRTLPSIMAGCDIVVAPLVDTIFNRAKSENKWIEAALVGVPVVASRVGAFEKSIANGRTGVLVNNANWFKALDRLIENRQLRERIGNNAYRHVNKNNTTVYTGYGLANFIRKKLARNIGFVLPSTDISGGVIVAMKHADILRRAGWDVTLIDMVSTHVLKIAKKSYQYRHDLPGFNVIAAHKTRMKAFFDTQVATLWSTVDFVKKYPNTRNRLYFVQNFETDFYEPGSGEPRFLANASYCDQSGIRYITMSLWCQSWLSKTFHKKADYISNGIDLGVYPYRERDFKGKVKILVEGDSKSEYKNTDEAFRIIENLDSEKFEIAYLSYRREPKDWYRVDHFYNRVAPEEVGNVYASCDILIKTSILESFSYPPLEMMATGGVVVVVPNGGNIEYLKDEYNCLFYEQGDIKAGVAAIQRILTDKKLRDRLIENGRQTAIDYQWSSIESRVVDIYK